MKESEQILQRLKADGWKESPDGIIVLMEKAIENRNPINADDDDTGIKLVYMNTMTNEQRFAIMLPDGSHIILNPSSIEHLQSVELAIDYFDCNY
jgi:hypothetical protein